jgi:hypothetical protein
MKKKDNKNYDQDEDNFDLIRFLTKTIVRNIKLNEDLDHLEYDRDSKDKVVKIKK